MVKVSTNAASFHFLLMLKLNKGFLSAHKLDKVMFDKRFRRNLYSIELAAWKSFRSFVCGFLGNKKEENYPQFVQRLLQNCQKLGWQM